MTEDTPFRIGAHLQMMLPFEESAPDPNERPTPMSELVSVPFWKLAAERAVKTIAQTAVALIGADAFDIITFDWVALGSVSAGAGVVSILTSIASARVGSEDDPSLV